MNLYQPTYLIKPVHESDENSAIKDEVTKKMKELNEKYHCNIIITRGKFPIWVYSEEGFYEIPTQKVKVVNTIGCGDALTAGIAYHLDKGETLKEAVQKAVVYSSFNASLLAPGSGSLIYLFFCCNLFPIGYNQIQRSKFTFMHIIHVYIYLKLILLL